MLKSMDIIKQGGGRADLGGPDGSSVAAQTVLVKDAHAGPLQRDRGLVLLSQRRSQSCSREARSADRAHQRLRKRRADG